MKNVLHLLPFVLLLVSCANKTYQLPEETYICKEWPKPISGSYGYEKIGPYLVQANSSYNDCKSKLKALRPQD